MLDSVPGPIVLRVLCCPQDMDAAAGESPEPNSCLESEQEKITMQWLHCLSYLFGGIFFTNAIPHYVSGVMGRAFQTPFAKPPGKGLSTSLVNVLWGVFNVLLGYLLIFRVGWFDVRSAIDVLSAGAGALGMSVMHAVAFGRFHGGNTKQLPPAAAADR